MVAIRTRWTLLTPYLITTACAQGLLVVNGQVFGSGLAVYNSPQPNTPMGGDTLHVSIEVTSNGRVEQPPLPDNFRNGIAGINIFLTSTLTGLNLTISNGTFEGWSKDALDTPEFLCNSTINQDFDNAGCRPILSQEAGSTVKHVNWVWPDCLVGDGGADNGDCTKGGPVENCLDGTARGPYNISFHETLRVNGSNFYVITDLPIRVTNSIPANTGLAASGRRPRCSLRNNPLIPYDQRDAAIVSPTMSRPAGGVPVDQNPTVDGNNSNDADGDKPSGGNAPSSSNNNANDEILNPGAPNSGSLGPDRLGADGSSATLVTASQMVLAGGVMLAGLLHVV